MEEKIQKRKVKMKKREMKRTSRATSTLFGNE
jgi:hypothetical protein